MFAGGRLARALGSIQYGVALDEDAARKQLIRVGQELVADGIAIVLNKPGTKHPMCTMTASERKVADQQAKDDAAADDDPSFHKRTHKCGLAHAISDPKTATRILSRVARRERFNIGIEPRASRLLIVDLDTPAQVAKFTLRAGTQRPTLTVRSPGSQDKHGNWIHSEGGHIHFEVPEGCDLPGDEGIYTDPDGWTATWGEHQVLVPPSVRTEGAYVLVGSTYSLPGWLRELVTDEAAGKRKRRDESRALRERVGPSAIDDWATRHGWAPILLGDGWIETGLTKNCGCPQWTAPGEHASPESATAHEPGCSAYTCDRGHGPLHVWTDNPSDAVAAAISAFGRRTLTMAQVLAYTEGAGNMRATLAEYGVPYTGDPTVLNSRFSTWEDVEESSDLDDSEEEDSEEEDLPEPDYDERMIRVEMARELRRRAALERIEAMDAIPMRTLRGDGFLTAPRPQPLVAGMLYRDSLARVYGAPGSGKSFVALDVALSIALGKFWGGTRMLPAPVIYVMAEGQAVNADRTEAWLSKHGERLDDNFVVVPDAVLLTEFAARDLVKLVEIEQPVLVVLDTKNAMMVGEENSATDFAVLRRVLDQIRKAAECCVVLVDHTGYEGTRARGSSAGTAAMDTEIRIEKDANVVTAEVTRDKASEAGTSWTWILTPEHPAAVLVRPPDGVGEGIVDPDKPEWREETEDGMPAWIRDSRSSYLHELARYMRFETSMEQDPSRDGRTLVNAVAALTPPTSNKTTTQAWRSGLTRAWSALKDKGCLSYWQDEPGTALQMSSGKHLWSGPK